MNNVIHFVWIIRLDDTNFESEYQGIRNALKYFKLKSGTIVTSDQKDTFVKDGLTIRIIPAHEYLI